MGKTKYVGTKFYIDPDTGEEVPMSMFKAETKGRRDFWIMYMDNLMKLMHMFGTAKMDVVEFFVNNMDSNYRLLMTNREIAKQSGISYATVSRALKEMEEANLIIRKLGWIQLNPKLFNNWTAEKEQYMVVKYQQLKQNKEE